MVSCLPHLISCISLVPSGANLLLLGDFNCPDVDWSSMSTSPSTPSSKFCDFILSRNLYQLVSEPTHSQGNCLDLVFTTNTDTIINLSVDSATCSLMSDHYLVTLFIHHKACPRPSKVKYVPDYSKANFTGLNDFIVRHFQDSPSILVSPDINKVWTETKKAIMSASTHFIPSRKASHLSQPKWFNSEIRHQINCIRTLRKSLLVRHSVSKQIKLHQLEMQLRDQIDSAKQLFTNKLISSNFNNQKLLFNHLRLLASSSSSPSAFTYQTKILFKPADIALAFNDYFNSVFTKSNYSLPPLHLLPSPPKQLHTITFDSCEVLEALTNLNPYKALGCDGISPLLVKQCASSLSHPLSVLFNSSLQSGNIPLEWKTHKICPVFKSGSPNMITNYRPISLLCIFAKVFESLIYSHILDFVQPAISNSQFGFQRGRSCLSQLLASYSEVYSCIDKGLSFDTIFLDFSKAFDTVPHQELLYKLWMIGITGTLWTWFRDYLHLRTHYVSFNEASSPALPVLSGVPQGSVLGPLLFLIYVNDLPSLSLYSSVFMFADDTKFSKCIASHNDSSLLQDDINLLSCWCKSWGLTFNQRKCACIRFTISNRVVPTPPSYNISGTPIQFLNDHRDLGITVSYDLSWNSHYSKICSSAYYTLHLIRRAIPTTAPITTKRLLYLSLVRSKITYCSQLWRPRLIKDILRLESVQRRATKFILSLSRYSLDIDYKDRLLQLEILPLMYWYELQDILFLVKNLHSPDTMDIFKFVSFVKSPTRYGSHSKLRRSSTRTTTTKHFYFNRVVNLWNSLPCIDISLSYACIKHFLFEHFWYHFKHNFNSTNPCTFHYLCPCSSCTVSNSCTYVNVA